MSERARAEMQFALVTEAGNALLGMQFAPEPKLDWGEEDRLCYGSEGVQRAYAAAFAALEALHDACYAQAVESGAYGEGEVGGC